MNLFMWDFEFLLAVRLDCRDVVGHLTERSAYAR
jgi:hypothetical protein